ncbi:MAG: beta-N-acetylhexosaminidase [Opitutaceae bacterium]|jgi:hexosaminidase|nr:beta-N-acetylhexosaminidase [Opitutaceae bacterium]
MNTTEIETLNVIPRPARIACDPTGAHTPLTAAHLLVCRDAALGRVFAETLFDETGLRLALVPDEMDAAGRPAIVIDAASCLATADATVAHAEGYALDIAIDGNIRIEASARAGAFYALQTLVQLLSRPNGNGESNGDGDGAGFSLPVAAIHDAPRFQWRGVLLDESRHFFGPVAVRRLLAIMARFKLNTLHWHLTDDQGWRIEIKKFPLLARTGAWRPSSPVPAARDKTDGVPYGGCYSQDEIREIVAFAHSLHIAIVPEIEVPGHSSAALAAYPQFGNTDAAGYAPPAVATHWGIFPNTWAPREETFAFLDAVFDEVCALFPDTPFFHIGGDEAPKTQWEASGLAQDVMRENGLADAFGLQSWFIHRVEKMLAARGRRIVGWDEIQEGGLSPTAVMMIWRDVKWARLALENGNDIVMTPASHCYLDHTGGDTPQTVADPWFEYIGGIGNRDTVLPLEKVYGFEPVPAGTPPERERQVLGCQANLWSEYLFDWTKAEYHLFPRLFALAEVAWSPPGKRDFENFRDRLPAALRYLDRAGVNYRRPDGSPARRGGPERDLAGESVQPRTPR